MKTPAPLTKGSTIALIAPSGVLQDINKFEAGVRILHELGYKTKFPRELWPGESYLADTDDKRADELIKMWNDPEVDAVMAVRGGYGCLRLADVLDLKAFSAEHKLFIGFSDITLLHSILNEKQGTVTLHGPVVCSLSSLSRQSLVGFENLLHYPVNNWEHQSKAEVLQDAGVKTGISTGGNLSTVVSTLGTKYAPDWRNKIVFLEDTAESTYRVDKMFTQLKLAGMFAGINALVLGDFSQGLGLDRTAEMSHHEAIWERALQLVNHDTSVWGAFPIGHGPDNLTIPFGIDLIINSQKRILACAVK